MFQVFEYQGADDSPLRYGHLSKPNRPSNGKAVLFVPGLGGSVKNAIHFLEQLLPEYDAIYGPDLRGFGLNLLEEPIHSIKQVWQDLEAFYQQVIVPAGHTELLLIGISLGGVLSTIMAIRHPERYSSLVLLAPAYRPHAKTFTLSYTVRTTAAFLFKGKRARTQLPYGLAEITNNEAILNDPQYNATPPLVLSPAFLLSVRDLANEAMSGMRTLKLPTLMIIPGQDLICDPAAMRQAFNRIPASTPKRCKEYPDFYHDVLFDVGHSVIVQEILGGPPSLASRSASLSSI